MRYATCDCRNALTTLSEETTTSAHNFCHTKLKNDGIERLLPIDFLPCPFTVIIGRGKRIAENIGNRRLRVLAGPFVQLYAKAMHCKAEKTHIVKTIVDMVKWACAENHCDAAFVRYSSGRWYAVDDVVAREKVGYQLRDLLGYRYESSSFSKVAKKQRLKQYEGSKIQDSQKLEAMDDDCDAASFASSTSSLVTNTADEPLQLEISYYSNHMDEDSFDENLLAPIPVEYPVTSSSFLQEQRLSFNVTQLLNDPLIQP
jgi:hypothetical protein